MILDLAAGILLSILTSALFSEPLTLLLLAAGIFFAVLPDLDVLWSRARPGENWWDKGVWSHREFTHYPALYVVATIVLALVSPVYAFMLGLGGLYHLLHDSYGTGWGIKWLWPFSENRYTFYLYQVRI
jgi:membrane-bound metal-dependent hydrolase YbcI (DUF457 family)